MSKASNLVPVSGKTDLLYSNMQTAIAECYSLDDCKNIANHATAAAAYFRQIKDDESVKKFLRVKIRAWRRIGEIIASAVDRTGCDHAPDNRQRLKGFNASAYSKKVREKFKDINLSDNDVRQAIKIMEVPADFFEKCIDGCGSVDAVISAFSLFQRREWEQTPEGKKAIERARKAADQMRTKQHEQMARELAEHDARRAEFDNLAEAQEEAFKEIGITLERRDRYQMKQVVFVIKETIHDTLRQAAFDNRTTMQAILRSGMMMWLMAHGYNVPVEEVNFSAQAKPSRRPSKNAR